jgi:hypothetical protein
LRSNDSLALYNLALVYASQGDLAKALNSSERIRLIDRRKWDELMIAMFGFQVNQSSRSPGQSILAKIGSSNPFGKIR